MTTPTTIPELFAEVERLKAENAELKARTIGLHWESNGEAGDGQAVCDLCGVESDEPHTVDECRQSIASHIDHGWSVAGQSHDELVAKDARIDALRAALMRHRELVAYPRAVGLDTLTEWQRELDAAIAADSAAGSAGGQCPECTGKLACERCGVQVSGHNEPGRCDGGTDNEPRFTDGHDDAGEWRDVNGCDTCNHTGRISTPPTTDPDAMDLRGWNPGGNVPPGGVLP